VGEGEKSHVKTQMNGAFSAKDKKKRSELVNLATEKCKSLFEGDETYSELEISLQ